MHWWPAVWHLDLSLWSDLRTLYWSMFCQRTKKKSLEEAISHSSAFNPSDLLPGLPLSFSVLDKIRDGKVASEEVAPGGGACTEPIHAQAACFLS